MFADIKNYIIFAAWKTQKHLLNWAMRPVSNSITGEQTMKTPTGTTQMSSKNGKRDGNGTSPRRLNGNVTSKATLIGMNVSSIVTNKTQINNYMFNSKTRTTASMQVHTTEDYFLFKSIDGNRNLNLLHLNRLRKSMSEKYLFTTILVNENYEIIDGQHRFEVIRELGLPLHYIICENYGLPEVHILNATQKTWNSDDYLEGYCKLGYPDYIKYRIFKKKYDFPHNVCMPMLSSYNSNKGGSDVKDFYNGNFKIHNWKKAIEIADNIILLEPLYAGCRRGLFIYAMLQLFAKPQFEFTEFIQKLRLQPTAMMDCQSSAQYITLIEQIYNYKRREKVNLRY